MEMIMEMIKRDRKKMEKRKFNIWRYKWLIVAVGVLVVILYISALFDSISDDSIDYQESVKEPVNLDTTNPSGTNSTSTGTVLADSLVSFIPILVYVMIGWTIYNILFSRRRY